MITEEAVFFDIPNDDDVRVYKQLRSVTQSERPLSSVLDELMVVYDGNVEEIIESWLNVRNRLYDEGLPTLSLTQIEILSDKIRTYAEKNSSIKDNIKTDKNDLILDESTATEKASQESSYFRYFQPEEILSPSEIKLYKVLKNYFTEEEILTRKRLPKGAGKLLDEEGSVSYQSQGQTKQNLVFKLNFCSELIRIQLEKGELSKEDILGLLPTSYGEMFLFVLNQISLGLRPTEAVEKYRETTQKPISGAVKYLVWMYNTIVRLIGFSLTRVKEIKEGRYKTGTINAHTEVTEINEDEGTPSNENTTSNALITDTDKEVSGVSHKEDIIEGENISTIVSNLIEELENYKTLYEQAQIQLTNLSKIEEERDYYKSKYEELYVELEKLNKILRPYQKSVS